MFALWIDEDGRFMFSVEDNGGVEISDDTHAALMAGQSAGQVIEADDQGRPVLQDPPPPTTDELVARYTAELEAYYDSKAKERRYDSRLTCTLRAGYPGPFQTEGVAFAVWMDNCNVLGYAIMSDVLAGERPMPTVAELIAELPELVWPV